MEVRLGQSGERKRERQWRRRPLARRRLNIAIAPLVSKDQEQIGRLIIFDDVTDRAELEQRLVQADKLSSIGLLAAGVAHEVNTPLAVISTYAQMLAKQVADDEKKSLLLDKIAKQTFRASEIVNSLLNFSRTSTTAFDHVKLERVAQETLSMLEHQLQKSGIQVTTDYAAGLDPVLRERGQAAAGISEPVAQRPRCHGGRRYAGGPGVAGGRLRARRDFRYGRGNRGGHVIMNSGWAWGKYYSYFFFPSKGKDTCSVCYCTNNK